MKYFYFDKFSKSLQEIDVYEAKDILVTEKNLDFLHDNGIYQMVTGCTVLYVEFFLK